jgi:hypothetical protein
MGFCQLAGTFLVNTGLQKADDLHQAHGRQFKRLCLRYQYKHVGPTMTICKTLLFAMADAYIQTQRHFGCYREHQHQHQIASVEPTTLTGHFESVHMGCCVNCTAFYRDLCRSLAFALFLAGACGAPPCTLAYCFL